MPYATTWMDPEILYSEVSQKKTNIMWYPLYVESEKKRYKSNSVLQQHSTQLCENTILFLIKKNE